MSLSILFGVDYSITSPSLTVKRLDGSYVNYAFWTERQFEKLKGIECGIEFRLLDGYARPKRKEYTDIEHLQLRATQVAWRVVENTMDAKFIPMVMAIEGYSFGSKNTFAHKIGEATGMLIATLERNHSTDEYFRVYRPSPQTLKKSCGAKIADGKAGTLAKFEEKFGLDFKKILFDDKPPKSTPAPINDVCDSWAALNWLEVNMNTIQSAIDNRPQYKCRGVH